MSLLRLYTDWYYIIMLTFPLHNLHNIFFCETKVFFYMLSFFYLQHLLKKQINKCRKSQCNLYFACPVFKAHFLFSLLSIYQTMNILLNTFKKKLIAYLLTYLRCLKLAETENHISNLKGLEESCFS